MSQNLALFCSGVKQLSLSESPLSELQNDDVQVKIMRGGICGSDLHYYNHGGFGTIKIKEPMVLGHEIAGVIEKIGKNVKNVKVGDKIALNPSLPCLECSYCKANTHHHCTEMRFYGSAMRFPHIHGAFRERVIAKARQAEILTASFEEGAFAEPLAVCLHAVKQAGDIKDKNILILGCGPIGALTLLAAKTKNPKSITVIDIADKALVMAKNLGATRVLNPLKDKLDEFKVNKGTFDILFEASGNNQAFLSALDLMKPRSTLVQLGLGSEFTLPINILVSKEFNWKGTFRFNEEFKEAVEAINSKKINVLPLLTESFKLKDFEKAFELASDKTKAMKVQIAFA